MILEQFYLGCLAQASYLIADQETGSAVIVDPRRDIGLYLDEAKERGLSINHVFLTHFHADFLAGHLELQQATGATIHLGAAAKAEFDFVPESEGSELCLGKLMLRVLETPGHTPESISILVFDLDKSADEPQAVLTGDTLFIGDVGRPDLMSSIGITAEELAGKLYDSLRTKLLPLPDATLVYPGHGAGSSCGKNLSSDTWSTLGEQRRSNYALQNMTREEFVASITKDQPRAPAYFAHDAVLNRSAHAPLTEVVAGALVELDHAALMRRKNEGAQVLDIRDRESYTAGHIPGSIHVPIDGRFASFAGGVLDPKRSIVLVSEAARAEEGVVRLGRIGFDSVCGFFVAPGPGKPLDADGAVATDRVDPADLQLRLDLAKPPAILDIRTHTEFHRGHIPQAFSIPLDELSERMAEVPREGPIVLICGTGYRSGIAASLMEGQGFDRRQLTDLRGGMAAWAGTGLPVVSSGETCSLS